MSKFFDLSFDLQANGSIRLEQESGIDEASVIDLHPWQLRAVAEHFGLVHPAPPADELTKLYAEQLCRVFLLLADDFGHLTPKMEAEWNRLDAFVDQMPSSLFPSHLWSQREVTEVVAGKEPVASAGDDHGEFALTAQEVER